MPLISVIIPAFNAPRTLHDTVASVLSQTLDDLELIVVNSAEQAKQAKIVELLASINDDRIQVINCEEANSSVNRNRGIAAATGLFIAFLDADDLWLPAKLEQQYQALQHTPNASVAYSSIDCIDEQSNFLRPGVRALWAGDVYGRLLVSNFIVNGSNVMVRREAIATVGLFDETLPSSQDYDLWLRLAEQYEFVPVDEIHVRYRISNQSLSFNVPRIEALKLRIFEQAFSRPKAKDLQMLRPYCMANMYKYLTSKSLDSAPQQQRVGLTLRLLIKAVYWDPSLAKKPIMAKIIFRLLILMLVPRVWTPALFKRLSRWTNTTPLLWHTVQFDSLPLANSGLS